MSLAAEINRREVLRGMAALSLAPLAVSVARAAAELGVADVTPDIKVVSGGGGNVVTFSTTAGLVLVDSGSADAREEVLAKVARIAKEDRKSPNGKVVALVNTHWHPEQTGANEALGMQGATIIAHAKTRQRLSSGWYVPKEDKSVKALPVAGRPTKTFHATDTATFGDQKLEMGYLIEAHTDGDVYVRFPGANVIVAGDAI